MAVPPTAALCVNDIDALAAASKSYSIPDVAIIIDNYIRCLFLRFQSAVILLLPLSVFIAHGRSKYQSMQGALFSCRATYNDFSLACCRR